MLKKLQDNHWDPKVKDWINKQLDSKITDKNFSRDG